MHDGPDPILDLAIESFVRDDQVILEGIEWTIRQGEHWALLGANGSGKSSLLSIVSAYEWPSRGRVRVLGEEYGRCDMNAVKRRLGVVGASMYQWLPRHERAIDVAASGLYALVGPWREYTDEDRAKALVALRAVSADAYAEKPYGLLSQGQKQRVMIARALVRKPELLVLDEPCDGLDPVARERFLEDVRRVCTSEGAPTLLYVTHHVEEIPAFVTHALLLRRGRVVARGPKADVLTSAHLSAAFDAACEVERHGERFRLVVRGIEGGA